MIRLFVPHDLAPGAALDLDEGQSRYLAAVMRQAVGDVALEIPRAPLAVGGLGQGDRPGGADREMLDDTLDRAVLAGGVASLEDHQVALAALDGPLLEADQGDLQGFEFVVVVGLGHGGIMPRSASRSQ